MNKYRAKPTTYNGRRYHSKAEANYAAQLDLLKAGGKIAEWIPQFRLPITVNGVVVCVYVADFYVRRPDDSKYLVEVKGYSTPLWKLKHRLFEACYPKIELVVVS